MDDDALDPVFWDFSQRRAAQKRRFGGEFFPAQLREGAAGRAFVEFFQVNKLTGAPKGIVAIRLTYPNRQSRDSPAGLRRRATRSRVSGLLLSLRPSSARSEPELRPLGSLPWHIPAMTIEPSLSLYQFNRHALSEHCRRALQAAERNVVLRSSVSARPLKRRILKTSVSSPRRTRRARAD